MNWKKTGKKIINDLKGNAAILNEKQDKMSLQLGRQEHYSDLNCLLIHGVPEDNNEDTNEIAVELFNTKTKNKPRPVIAKLIRYNNRW